MGTEQMTLEQKLQKVIDLLEQADAEIQAALPESISDECYNIHNDIQNVIDLINDLYAEISSN